MTAWEIWAIYEYSLIFVWYVIRIWCSADVLQRSQASLLVSGRCRSSETGNIRSRKLWHPPTRLWLARTRLQLRSARTTSRWVSRLHLHVFICSVCVRLIISARSLHTCFPHRLKRFSSQHLKRRSGNRTWPKSSISMKMKMAVRSFHRPHLRSIRGQRGRGKGTWLRKTLTRVMEMNRHRIIGTLHDWCCSLLLCVCVQVGVFSLSLPRQTRSRRNAQCVGHQRSGSAAGISEESHNAASRAEASPGERRLHHRHRLYGQPGVSPQEPRAGPAGAHLHWPTHTHTHIKTLKSSFKLKIL